MCLDHAGAAARAGVVRVAVLSVGEVDCVAEILQIVDAAPVAVHVHNLHRRAVGNERVEERRYVELVEVRARAQPGHETASGAQGRGG